MYAAHPRSRRCHAIMPTKIGIHAFTAHAKAWMPTPAFAGAGSLVGMAGWRGRRIASAIFILGGASPATWGCSPASRETECLR